jgi:hypothetical protein
MHPNEVQDPPEEIALVETVERDRDGARARFLVYRYMMAPGHWAAKDGWLLGLAGPFVDSGPAYSATAFSRCDDVYGELRPAELVDWYVDMLTRKGVL